MDYHEISKIYNQVADCYDKKYLEPIHKIEDTILSKILKSCISDKTNNILDIGCGTGHVVNLGEIKKEIYHGIDISEKSIHLARKKFPDHRFYISDVTNCNLHIKSDLLLCIYGQLNYLGLNQSIIIFKKFLRNVFDSQFIAVLYSGNGHKDYDYTKKYQTIFSPSQIKSKFKNQMGLDVFLYGFSFFDVDLDIEAQYNKMKNTQLNNGDEFNCKYLLISNKEVFNEK